MWRPGANLNWTETWLCKSFKGTSGDYGNFSIWGVMATYGNFTGSAWQRSEEVSCALCQGDIGTMCLIPQVAWSTRDPVARCSTMFMYSHSLIVWSHVLDCPGTFYIEVLVDFLILWPHFPNQAAGRSQIFPDLWSPLFYRALYQEFLLDV